jgi:hypothetical protein
LDSVSKHYKLSRKDAAYFVHNARIDNKAYVPRGIMLLFKDGSVRDFADASDHLDLPLLSKVVAKSFLCYPKDIPDRPLK